MTSLSRKALPPLVSVKTAKLRMRNQSSDSQATRSVRQLQPPAPKRPCRWDANSPTADLTAAAAVPAKRSY